MGEESFVAQSGYCGGLWPLSGVLRELQAGGGSEQRREGAVASFLSSVVFPGLRCTLPKGSVLSWVWAQAEGRAREGLFPSRGRRHMVISDIGRPGCWAVFATQVLLARPSDSWGPWLCHARCVCREGRTRMELVSLAASRC